jgi:hypothetical protein
VSTYGKYRGIVELNEDPLQLGRVQVSVPALSPERLGWATPCLPYAPPDSIVAVPPVGTTIWVEFEGGDIARPVWSGCFWNPGEGPRFEPA